MNAVYGLVLLLSAAVCLAVVHAVWPRRSAAGATGLIFLMAALCEWSLAYGISWLVADPYWQQFWLLCTYIGSSLTPAAVLIVALGYTRSERVAGRWWMLLLFMVPLASLMIVAVPALRPLYFGSAAAVPHLVSGGPWFYVDLVYTYAVVGVAMWLLAAEVGRTSGHRQRQAALVLAAVLIPLGLNLLGYFGVTPLPDVDMAPLLFTVSGALVGYALFRYQLFVVLPLARERIFEELRDGLVVMDLDGRIIDVNPAGFALAGSRNLVGLSAEEAFPSAVDLLGRVRINGTAEGSSESDPSRRFEVGLSTVRDSAGAPIANVATIRDVTERHRAEEALRESERRLARVLEGAGVGTWEWDIPSGQIAHNDRWYEMLGFEATEEPHDSAAWLTLVHPDDRSIVEQAARDTIAGLSHDYDVTYRMRTKSGGWRWILDRGRVVEHTDDGAPLKMAGTLVDVTAQEQATQQLAHDQALLEGLSRAISKLLADDLLRSSHMLEALQALGETVHADAVHVFEHEPGEASERVFVRRFAWSDECARREGDGAEPGMFRVEISQEHGEALRRREVILGGPAEFPGDELPGVNRAGIASVLYVPVWVGQRFWGFMRFDTCSAARTWDPSEIRLLETAASSFGAAVERRRLGIAEHEQRMFAEALRDTAAAMSSTLDFDGVLDRIFESLRRTLKPDSASIALYDPAQDNCRTVRASGYGEEGDRWAASGPPRRLADYGLMRRMKDEHSTVVVHDTRDEPMWVEEDTAAWVRAYAGAPVYIRDELIGFLHIDGAEPGRFEQRHADQLRALADQAAIAIENARLHESTKRLALTDELTGVYNRHGLTQIAQREIDRAKRNGAAVAVAVVDVDRFKHVNDRFGHAAGDQVLAWVARCCISNVRSIDVVARFGGDELLLLFPDTDARGASIPAERIREAVRAGVGLNLPGDGGGPVTVCLGVASGEGPDLDLDALLSAADRALYAAKHNGRDRVEIA